MTWGSSLSSVPEVLGFVGLFNKVILDFGPPFLGFIKRGACFGLLGVDSIGNFGVYWVRLDIRIRGN